MKSKLTSRKFWVSVAAVLASVGTAVTGIATDNDTLTTVGVICTSVSAAIYSICEGLVDKAAVGTEVSENGDS